MANIIDMPKLSDTMTVGTLVKWLKQEGDAVKNGDMIAEVETDKATMELECFFDGTLLKIFIPAGSQVPIGAALCAVGKPGEKVSAPAAPAAAPSKVEGPAKPAAKTAALSTAEGAAPGKAEAAAPKAATPAEAPVASKTGAPVPTKAEAAQPAAAPVAAAPAPAPTAVAAGEGASGRIKISPLARKIAADKGIDLATLTGTGPGGRIVRADVLAGPSAAPAGAPARSNNGAPVQEEKLVPVSNMRAIIARRLLESKTQLPHFYLDVEIDAEPLLALRAQINGSAEAGGVKLSVNDFILKAAAAALRRVPAINCSWEDTPTGPAIRHHGAAHVSFAVAMEDGLITPVVRDAHLKSIFAIGREARSLGDLARAKKLQLAQFTGGTFCVSNLGMMGTDHFYAIINPPNAAILAVGAVIKKPVVKNDQIVIGQRMSLALSADHRVVNGSDAAAFAAALRDLLEKPAILLL